MLSFALLGRLAGVGVGTVVTVLVTGNIVNFSNERIPLIRRVRSLAAQE